MRSMRHPRCRRSSKEPAVRATCTCASHAREMVRTCHQCLGSDAAARVQPTARTATTVASGTTDHKSNAVMRGTCTASEKRSEELSSARSDARRATPETAALNTCLLLYGTLVQPRLSSGKRRHSQAGGREAESVQCCGHTAREDVETPAWLLPGRDGLPGRQGAHHEQHSTSLGAAAAASAQARPGDAPETCGTTSRLAWPQVGLEHQHGSSSAGGTATEPCCGVLAPQQHGAGGATGDGIHWLGGAQERQQQIPPACTQHFKPWRPREQRELEPWTSAAGSVPVREKATGKQSNFHTGAGKSSPLVSLPPCLPPLSWRRKELACSVSFPLVKPKHEQHTTPDERVS